MTEAIEIKGKRCGWSKRTRPPFGCDGKPTHIVKSLSGHWVPCCKRHSHRFIDPLGASGGNVWSLLIQLECKEWDFNNNCEITKQK